MKPLRFTYVPVGFYSICIVEGVKGSTPKETDKPVTTSMVVQPITTKKVRHISLMEGKEILGLVEEGFQEVINRYEKKNGAIPVIPVKQTLQC